MTDMQKMEFLHCLENHISKFKGLEKIEPRFMTESKKRLKIDLPVHFEEFYKVGSEHVHQGYNSLFQHHIKPGSHNHFQAQQPVYSLIAVNSWSLLILMNIIREFVFIIYFNVIEQDSFNHNLKNIYEAIKSCEDNLLIKLRKRGFNLI